jgi:hypothetical protein
MDAVPQTPSFLHLHLGLDATGLGALNCHYAVVDDWSKRESAQKKEDVHVHLPFPLTSVCAREQPSTRRATW